MVNATAKYVRVSPRKAGDVAALIRGKKVAEAKAILTLSPRAAAKLVGKVLALGRGQRREQQQPRCRRPVRRAGPTSTRVRRIKRFQPRAMGRASRIRKRTSHITVSVDEKKES